MSKYQRVREYLEKYKEKYGDNKGEMIIIPRHIIDPTHPKMSKPLQVVPRSEVIKNPRKYTQLI